MKIVKPQEFMEESTDAPTESDIYQQLLDRYSKSVAPQHRHLCEIAAAIRTIIKSESLPITPLSYFTIIIDVLSDAFKPTVLDADTVSGLLSFLAIVLPLVPEKSIDKSKAAKAAEIVVEVVDNPCEGLQVSSVRALSLVKCLGSLLEFCDLGDWESVQLGFQTLIKYSVDKFPKVRKCAQDYVLKVFKSFQSRLVKIKAGKSVIETFKTYMSLAVKTVGSRSDYGSKEDEVSICEHLEVLHMLDLLKSVIPCFPSKVISKAIAELQKSLSAKFSPLTRHVLDVMEEILRFFESDSEVTVLHTVKIVNRWNRHYSIVIDSIAGLLTSEATATRASKSLKEMIKRVDLYADVKTVEPEESTMVKSFCDTLLKVLSTHPNEHSLTVISALFRELGITSHTYMGSILVKLASFMTVESGNTFDVKHLQECIGSAVLSMGADKVFALLPISIDASGLTCKNTWLIPILNEYVMLSSLGFFIKTIAPLAESFQKACQKVQEKSEIREQLQSHSRDCWGLLPAFCRHPVDTYESFGSLAKILIANIKQEEFMLESSGIALQRLVKENKNPSFIGDDKASKLPKFTYQKETATRNIKALSSSSKELLEAFTEVFFKVSLDKRAFVKDTIGCLALISEYSTVKAVFTSVIKRTDRIRVDKSPSDSCLILELASSLFGATSIDPTDFTYMTSSLFGATSIDPTDFTYNSIKECLQQEDDKIESEAEAYATLYKVLVESSEFRFSKFEELMDLLLDLKSPVNVTSLRWRFSCFKTLLVHSIEAEITCDGEKTYGSCMLNEIIVTLNDSKEESKKVAYDILLETKSILQKTSSSSKRKRGPYYEFITMIMGHLSGSSPQIRSGAVFALTFLVSDDSRICHSVPDLVPTILELLGDEDNKQTIKAVLEFLKMLVLSLEVTELQKILSYILDGVLPWSIDSRHFKSKLQVTSILEIMMQKCGSASVKFLVPEKYQDYVKNVLENQGKTSSLVVAAK